jgi:hypothetical protein
MVGHSFGRAGRRHLLAAVVFALLVTPLVSVILDLDRARKGLIRENINSVRNLRLKVWATLSTAQ